MGQGYYIILDQCLFKDNSEVIMGRAQHIIPKDCLFKDNSEVNMGRAHSSDPYEGGDGLSISEHCLFKGISEANQQNNKIDHLFV